VKTRLPSSAIRWVTLTAAILVAGVAPQGVLAAVSTNEIHFQLRRGYTIVARGSIGNLKNLNFLIDTGAVPSILDGRIAKKLRLTGTVGQLSIFTKELDAERVTTRDVNLGPFHADVLPALVRDLSYLQRFLGTRVDAVIGFAFLNQSPFTIDYESKKITVGPLDPSLAAIPYEAHPGFAVVEMKLQKRSLRLMVDTGASGLVLFESARRDFMDAFRIVGTQIGSNMGGDVRLQIVRVADVYLGSMPWGTRDAFIMADTGGNYPSELQGLLGVASLKARRVGFDPEHKIFAWDIPSGSLQLAREPQTQTVSNNATYSVQGATPEREAVLRHQIQLMQPAVLPYRVHFVPHWQYVYAAKIYQLHVPTGHGKHNVHPPAEPERFH
jgi:predicted aspartyl protease